ncbi:MAG: hypothetical protein CM15mP109_15410 [Candidatus Dadabacteria bacterium]|nr:MAG: hypothetical protein CM15mP109_15410 [Candidatus Dadabacteria bacterium]
MTFRRSSGAAGRSPKNLHQEPWKKKDDIIRLNTIVYTTLEIVRKLLICYIQLFLIHR